MKRLLLPLALLLAAPAAAQEWRMAPEYDVQLSTYDIQPPEIRLKAGEPVRLRFVNNSNQDLTFSAGDFFRSAQMRRRDAGLVKGGTVKVPPLSTRTVVLVPKPGRYRAQGANFLHRLLGMSGRIIVE
jgi:plastocyanin